MNTNTKKILTLALTGVATLSLFASTASAEGFSHYGQNSRGFGNTNTKLSIAASKDLGKNIYALDNLADQMAFRLGWELKFSKSSKASTALLAQMKKHTTLTNDLIKAYRGKSNRSLEQTAFAVSRSVDTLKDLRRDAKISDSVSNMITQSIPLISFVTNNAANFSPVSS